MFYFTFFLSSFFYFTFFFFFKTKKNPRGRGYTSHKGVTSLSSTSTRFHLLQQWWQLPTFTSAGLSTAPEKPLHEIVTARNEVHEENEEKEEKIDNVDTVSIQSERERASRIWKAL